MKDGRQTPKIGNRVLKLLSFKHVTLQEKARMTPSMEFWAHRIDPQATKD